MRKEKEKREIEGRKDGVILPKVCDFGDGVLGALSQQMLSPLSPHKKISGLLKASTILPL
jgi:hypothetical protein